MYKLKNECLQNVAGWLARQYINCHKLCHRLCHEFTPAALNPLGVHTPPVRIFSQSPFGVRSGAEGMTKDPASIEIAAVAIRS
jgi:hypothetical protein